MIVLVAGRAAKRNEALLRELWAAMKPERLVFFEKRGAAAQAAKEAAKHGTPVSGFWLDRTAHGPNATAVALSQMLRVARPALAIVFRRDLTPQLRMLCEAGVPCVEAWTWKPLAVSGICP